MAENPFVQLNNLYKKLEMLPGDVTQTKHLTPEDRTLLQRIGLTSSHVRSDLLKDVQIHYDRYNLYQQIERCLSGSTKIWLLDGSSPTIREIVENPKKYIGKYTLSINPTTLKLEPDKIISAKKTRLNTKLVRIHLDNDKYVDCTLDHRFMLRDGTYREAQYLKPNDSLMPLYLKHPRGPLKDYLLVYKPKTNSYSFIHRVIAKFLDSTYKTSQGKVPHHVNFDKLDNDPSNIQIMDSTEHKKLHGRISRKKHKPDCNCGSCKAGRGENKGENNPCYGKHPWNYGLTKETDPRMSEVSKNLNKQVKKICQECGVEFPVHRYRAEDSKYCSNKCANIAQVKNPVAIKNRRKAQERVKGRGPSQRQLAHLKKVHEKNKKQKEIRICLTSDCDVTFEVLPSSKRKYCCGPCANRNIGKRKETRQKHSITQTGLWSDKEYQESQTEKQRVGRNRIKEQKAQLMECLLNHKVARIEFLDKKEDTYDINTERNHNFPLEIGVFIHNSLEHPLVGAATELYGNYCTVWSPMHNSTCWITSESPTYQKELTKLLDRIGIEERIFDWAYTTGSYGDMFVKVNGIPGKGVISLDDDEHPLNTSRVDHEGVLIGYYKTPMGQTNSEQALVAPWEYAHFRLLGGKKKRPRFCLRGDTKIRLLDRTSPTIKEMADSPERYIGKSILSINPKTRKLEYDIIVNAEKTRLNARLVRVHLDNDKYVDCTEDHKFMLRDGTYREAQYLQPDDSLMPLYTKVSKYDLVGYEMVFDPGKNRKGIKGGYVYTHRIPFNPKQKKGYVIHHGPDFNPLNNDLENLTRVTRKEHVVIHQGDLDSQKARTTTRLATLEKRRQDPDYQTKLLEKRILEGKWEIRICALSGCNTTFVCSVKDSKKYCDLGCQHAALRDVPKSEEHKQHMRKPKSAAHRKHIGEGRKKVLAEKKEQGIVWVPWNKDLTKETDSRVAKYAEHLRQVNTGKKQSKETIRKRVETQKENKQKAQLMECLLNHKVIRIEFLDEREDTYDITTKKNHNFPLDVGVFVHNSDPKYSEFRTMHLLTGQDVKQVTTKYGTSLLLNALPSYRRLRLAEDSLLLARLSRGLIRYIWKLKVDSCLKGDTQISLMNGMNPTIGEMAKNLKEYIGKYVLTVNEKTKHLEPKQIKNVKKTRKNAQLVNVYLDNGKFVSCTPDHCFMLRDGTYKEAHYLQSNDSLMPFDCVKSSVISVEWMKKREDTYDIEIDGTPNFPLTAGVFIHNSNMESVGELVDQYSRVLREARAVDTREATANFDSRENPMCLRGNTQIRLCNGKDVTIREMAENPDKYVGGEIWSLNSDFKIDKDIIVAVQKTRLNAELVRVYLSDQGGYVDSTPDHRFMLRDGTYKEAQYLVEGDHLKSCTTVDEIKESIRAHGRGTPSSYKVVKVEQLEERDDTYDITTKKYHNFSVGNGVFVHNSVIEDIFLPVWGGTGDLTFDKIGGEADIRWIRDIEDLRQQLAAALRTPLPLLGAYLKEATGPLGSQAIEKLDINFARMARKLQRTVRNGIKRICQIHLAYMNMDPDPDLFDVQMPEMSTAEEESLKESLKSGMDVIGQVMDIIDSVMEGDERDVDKVELFHYFNQKFLKLEDLDLKDFLVSTKLVTECKRRKDRIEHEQRIKHLIEKALNLDDNKNRLYPKPILDNMDLVSYVPTTTHTSEGKLNKRAVSKLCRRGGWIGVERSKSVWKKKYGSCMVMEGEIDKDVVVGGQGVLPFKE